MLRRRGAAERDRDADRRRGDRFVEPFRAAGAARLHSAVFDPYTYAKPFLHMLDPEDAHELTMSALELNVVPGQPRDDDPVLATTLFGRTLPNPVGVAAGFDKNGRVYERMGAHGFGFVEIGGVTPRAQRGNPRPRVFRLPDDGAVINRMGFPNEGADALEARLRRKGLPAIGFGIDLASNADSADPAADFVALAQRFAPYADYLTLDVSCPNTANGQVFLDPAQLADLMARLAAVAWSFRPAETSSRSWRPTWTTRCCGGWGRRCSTRASTASWCPTRRARGPPVCGACTRTKPAGCRASRCSGPRPRCWRACASSPAAPCRSSASAASRAVAMRSRSCMRAPPSCNCTPGLIYAGTALVTKIKRELAELLRRNGPVPRWNAAPSDRG